MSAPGSPASDARRLAALAERWFPDGVVGQLRMPEGRSFIASHGLGSRVWDIEGREYLDFVLGSGPLILGHAHPAVLAAVGDQLARGSTYYTASEPVIRLADEIGRAAPGIERIRFTNSGSEATFSALRFARAFTGREKVLKFEGGFHGGHDHALMSMHPVKPPAFPEAVPDSAGIPRSAAADVLIAPFNDLNATREIVEAHAHDIAAIIVEPLQRYLSPMPGFLPGLRALASARDILLVFDEVVTGFRLAYGGAQEYYGVTADLVAYGKAIGGGFPTGAVGGRRDVLDLCASMAPAGSHVYHGGTFSGNPISAAAGLATLAELRRPGAHARLHELGRKAREGLARVLARHGHAAQVLGDGPIFQVLFTADPVADYRASLRADRERAFRFHAGLVRQGMLVNVHSPKCYLSLAHSDEDLERLFAAADVAAREC
jgi:glutamate-1-semialdehyde 2,1-aminomutase